LHDALPSYAARPGEEAQVTVAPAAGARRGRKFVVPVLFVLAMVGVGFFFALPLAWLVTQPFDATPTMTVSWPDWTLENFSVLAENPYALRSIGNSLVLGIGTIAVVVTLGSLAAYALSRGRVPGRDGLLYALLLLSSVVTGTAAMVPLFRPTVDTGLINTQTGVVLALSGGVLPTVAFILKARSEGRRVGER